ncbi:hypothetical protein [Calothrix sp. PCC 6303]|uniref:hypothetical protein n=1 Tax=Calothrix sp. PCC 6303 TaxID=1170562 RepID=UPI0002A0595F|nr:hypothetical protein [Calothrix sp. PCC 6303]AFZ01132.1 hypothetical protein Cal6303_2106 [Calothrix sp. PCC 6303]
MDVEPQDATKNSGKYFLNRKPLELLRETEALLRRPTVSVLAPILPANLSQGLDQASLIAEDTLENLAKIDLDEITDFDLRTARIHVGLSFVGFGALMLVILLLYLQALHPEMSASEQIYHYWYEYVWFVNLGVAGMFVLGREAMRPVQKNSNKSF